MAIPKKTRSYELIGQRVKLGHDVCSYDCSMSIPAGTELEVTDASRGFVLSSPEPCPCCGISIRAQYIKRDEVFLTGDENAPHLASVALWQSRKDQGDHLWAECSNCGFTVENYKAAVLGHSSDDYVRPNYKHCPMCGKRMGVKNYIGKVVLD